MEERWARAKRAGTALIAIGYVMCGVFGAFLVAAAIGSLSSDQEFVAGSLLVAGMSTALTGGTLVNAASQRPRRTDTGSAHRQSFRIARAIGTIVLAAGALGLLAGCAVSVLKLAGSDVAFSWVMVSVQFGVDVSLMAGGLAIRRLAEHVV